MSAVVKFDLSSKQKKAVGNMQNAIWALQRAQEFMAAALGGTDVGDEYKRSIEELIEDMSTDLDAIADGEVYEFKE